MQYYLENKIASSHYGFTAKSVTNVIEKQEVKKLAKVMNDGDLERCANHILKRRVVLFEVLKHDVAGLLIYEIVILSTLMINKSSI